MPIHENEVKKSNIIDTNVNSMKEAELSKNVPVNVPAANAEPVADEKIQEKKDNASIAREKTLTKLKADSPKTIREVKNVKVVERNTEAMFDLNETVGEFSFIEEDKQEAEQEVKQEDKEEAKQEAKEEAKQEAKEEAKQEDKLEARQEDKQEAGQNVILDERTSIEDEGLQAILEEDIFK